LSTQHWKIQFSNFFLKKYFFSMKKFQKFCEIFRIDFLKRSKMSKFREIQRNVGRAKRDVDFFFNLCQLSKN